VYGGGKNAPSPPQVSNPRPRCPLAPAGLGIRSMSVIAHFNTYR